MIRPRIAVLALGAANRASIALGLERAGARPAFVDSADGLSAADAIVVPGVAHFGYVVDALDRCSLRAPLLAVIASGTPLLGICVGFQLLFERSEEAPGARGLGVFRGAVRAVMGPKSPHIGWNRVEPNPSGGWLSSGWAYFAHGFAPPASIAAAAARTRYGAPFASVAVMGATIGVQFHPERSGAYGASLLRRFVEGCRSAG